MNNNNQNENATSEGQREQTESWNIFSVVLHLLLPVAGLAIFLKQKHIFSKFLLQLDRNCVSVFCPSFSRREKLLKWAGSRLPQTWSSQSRTLSGGVSVLWADGSLLCTLINSAIPGACLNPHRHWRKPPLHAQAIAYKYLGVVPIFTEKDLSGDLTVTLERKFLHYLNEIQQAILRLAERNEMNRTTSALYVARGMGLYTGEQHRKTVFYVYPNTKPTICNNSNIIIHIRGPYGTYGKAIIPKFHNDLFTTNDIKLSPELLITKNLLQKTISRRKNPFMKNFSLPFMHYHKKHMGDNIVIHVTMEDERAKVTYIPKNYGMYEIIMISNGEIIRGCPFDVHILNNTSGIQETLESEEKEEEIPHARKRKVISKTIDFIDEQMPMADLRKRYKNRDREKETKHDLTKFKEVVNKITDEKHIADEIETAKSSNKVNSTLEDTNIVIHNISNLQPIREQESFNLQDRKIDEEDEILLHGEINNNDETDSFKINNENFTDDSSILEKQNVESVNENQKSKSQPTDRQNLEYVSNENNYVEAETTKVNGYNDIDNINSTINNDILADVNLKLDSDDSNRRVDNQIDQKCRHNIADGNQESKLSINEYPKPFLVNKIHIPEKFCALQKSPGKSVIDGSDTKHFKNVINSSNKREIPRNLLPSIDLQEDDVTRLTKTIENFPIFEPKTILNQTDDNDSGNDTISSLEDNEVKQNLVKALSRPNYDIEKLNAVPKRFFQTQEFPKVNAEPLMPISKRQSSTSPICTDHIAPEVNSEFRQMSVAEKRKIFAQQPAKSVSHSTNSLFSDHENVEVLTPRQFHQFEGLSVLNFLGSLKETENSRKINNYELCSTKSLPNIPSVGADYIFHNSVKERKDFWEKLSSSSSSLTINIQTSPRRKPKKMTEEERLRLIWKKPNESEVRINNIIPEERTDLKKSSEMCKSADDILSINNYVSYHNPKKYKSLDNSLDNCTVMSIEERKKMLLKQHYEKEKIETRNVRTLKKNNHFKLNYNNNASKNITEETNENRNNDDIIVFSPIIDKIKQYDKAYGLAKNVEEVEMKTNASNTSTNKNKDSPKNFIQKEFQELPKPQEVEVKSHFKKAIKYFKNLEEKSLGKSKTKFGKGDCRRYALDMQLNKFKNKRRGGSLNLPKVSERFSVNNLYEDVFGSKRGSFKGAVNRSALVDALATFSRKEPANITGVNEDDIADIKYDIFKKRAKTKRRKSIRSIFDMYY